MNQFWSIILNIVIFIISLGALIVIHEAGHLATAKIFKVYCYEFSIGMGPALYSHKPKKGHETIFSIRAFPVGGYVSMAGEDLEDAEGVDKTIEISKDRTIEGKKRWKRIIIFAAGVTMNFILGYLLFFINYAAVPQITYELASPTIEVVSSSLASTAELQSGDEITAINQDIFYIKADGTYSIAPDITISNPDITCYGFEDTPPDLLDYNKAINVALSDVVYHSDGTYTEYSPLSENDKRVITFTYSRIINNVPTSKQAIVTTTSSYSQTYFFSKSTLKWGTVGISASKSSFMYSVGDAFVKAWNMWCYACSAIFVGLAKLFTPTGITQVGGVVAIFEISSAAVASGFGAFLNLWGLLSVNLAIMNLLPFPGLDGWQIIVTIVEGIGLKIRKFRNKNKYTHITEEQRIKMVQDDVARQAVRDKKYKKIRNIVSAVGLILLLVLAAVLVIKDIFFPIIG